MFNMTTLQENFFRAKQIAVVGVSHSRSKYGNICYRFLRERHYPVVAVHPRHTLVEGDACFPTLAACPTPPDAVLSVIPPQRGVDLVDEAVRIGAHVLWFQPGAESPEASQAAADAGIPVVDDGSCVMVLASRAPKPLKL